MPNDLPTATPEAGESAYRVLIVEDDRSQAQFAESILKGSGMWTCLVSTAAEVQPAIEEFEPDLVLMDLHLPDASGIELTARLRQDPTLSQLPIVFLTGDTDPETEFHVLDSGADDYLSKPIRPRHLIAAVQSRVRRARLARKAHANDGDGAGKDPNTGLLRRDRVLPALAQAPGALLVEIQNVPALQERYGYAGVEQLMRGAGRTLAGLAPDAAARLNDKSFLVLSDTADGSALQARARELRAGVGQPIEIDDQPIRLRAAIGWSPLAGTHAAADPIGALEQALRDARPDPAGIAGHDPDSSPQPRDLSHTLEAALHEGRLELVFQPVVSVEGGNESRFQALLRIRDEEGELRSAGPLLAATANPDLLRDIDRWVLGQALSKLVDDPSLHRLFVSQTQQAIASDPEGRWLLQAMEERGVEAPRLVVDLRMEDVLVHNLMLADYCRELAEQGARFCLSQYRHGTDSAAVLAQLPLAYVRLAREYAHLESEPSLRDELREVIALAHQHELKVIGSQVESPSAAAALWMAGVDFIQGNLVQGVGKALDFDFHHSVL